LLSDDLVREGQRVMTVCNACRYCEGYCPVFQAMEERPTFAKGDLAYLANLCHNCGECLYACQYAPPHEFGINVPRTLAAVRLASYEEYCWPNVCRRAFTRQPVLAGASLILGFVVLSLTARAFSGDPLPASSIRWCTSRDGGALLQRRALRGAALVIAHVRFRRGVNAAVPAKAGPYV